MTLWRRRLLVGLRSGCSVMICFSYLKRLYQTNHKINHRREIAQWEEALESLVYKDLLKESYFSNGHKMF